MDLFRGEFVIFRLPTLHRAPIQTAQAMKNQFILASSAIGLLMTANAGPIQTSAVKPTVTLERVDIPGTNRELGFGIAIFAQYLEAETKSNRSRGLLCARGRGDCVDQRQASERVSGRPNLADARRRRASNHGGTCRREGAGKLGAHARGAIQRRCIERTLKPDARQLCEMSNRRAAASLFGRPHRRSATASNLVAPFSSWLHGALR